MHITNYDPGTNSSDIDLSVLSAPLDAAMRWASEGRGQLNPFGSEQMRVVDILPPASAADSTAALVRCEMARGFGVARGSFGGADAGAEGSFGWQRLFRLEDLEMVCGETGRSSETGSGEKLGGSGRIS